MKCSKCGSNITKEDEFCPECGTKLKSKGNSNIAKYYIAGGVALILIIAIILLTTLIPKGEKCKSPYIEFKTGECCLDANRNNVCDNDEKIAKETKSEEKTDEELFLNSVCTLPAGIYCDADKITANAITLALANDLGFDITDVSLTANVCAIPATGSLRNGERDTFMISGCSLRKDRFPMDFHIAYTNLDSGLTHKVQGSLTGGYKCIDGIIATNPAECANKIIGSVGEEEESTEIDLSNYPNFFIDNNKFYGAIIVSDKASAEEVIAASDIAISIQFATPQKIDVGATHLVSEVPMIEGINTILIGNACNNQFISDILNNPRDCNFGLEPGVGKINLYESNGRPHLVVSGYSPIDIRNAAQVLANYKDYNLRGNSIEVMKVNNQLVAVEVE